jgi:anti-sigma B factor antagonist
MPIGIRVKDGVRILDMAGDFAVGHHVGQPVDLRGHRLEDLGETINALLDTGVGRVVLNLEKVRFIDSAGLGQLIACRKRTLDRGGDIKLLNPGRQVKDVLVMTLLADVFEIFDDEAGAVASFQAPGPLSS